MDLEGHVMLVTARVEFERLSQLFLLRARAFCPGEWLRPRRMEAEEARVVCWRLGLALGFPMRASWMSCTSLNRLGCFVQSAEGP